MASEGGTYLAELREKRGLALEQVTKILAAHYQIRISRSALSRYETGARTHPDALLLWGLSQVYDEPLEAIITKSRGRSDLPRHSTSPDSSHAATPAPRDADLAAQLTDAIAAIARVAEILRGKADAAVAHSPARLRHRRTAH